MTRLTKRTLLTFFMLVVTAVIVGGYHVTYKNLPSFPDTFPNETVFNEIAVDMSEAHAYSGELILATAGSRSKIFREIERHCDPNKFLAADYAVDRWTMFCIRR